VYAELELDPEPVLMCGQLPPVCAVGRGAVEEGVVDGVVADDGIEPPWVAAHATPTPIVRAATATSRTVLIRAMGTSFRPIHRTPRTWANAQKRV